MTIVAAADGSSLGNPGPAGWCWYIDDERWAAGGWPSGTNNQGELHAVLALLEATAGTSEPLRILCDSQYVINSVTKWRHGWKKNGWRKKSGQPVLNVDYMKAIDAALVGRSVEFEWVKGHSGHTLNEAADSRARAVAEAYQRGSTPNSGPGYTGEPVSTATDTPPRHGGRRGDAPTTTPDVGGAQSPQELHKECGLFDLPDQALSSNSGDGQVGVVATKDADKRCDDRDLCLTPLSAAAQLLPGAPTANSSRLDHGAASVIVTDGTTSRQSTGDEAVLQELARWDASCTTHGPVATTLCVSENGPTPSVTVAAVWVRSEEGWDPTTVTIYRP